MTDKLSIHIDSATKHDGIPELGEGEKCAAVNCPGPNGWDTAYGLAGGGVGVYTYCPLCGRVTSKTEESES